jgi:hypothetical protein
MAELLSNIERRVIANLSIPRNTHDLATVIRADPYSGEPEFVPDDLLAQLAGEGWVVNLGSKADDPAQLAAALEKHKSALAMPDDKARTYAARLSMPHRAWRFRGDLWVMTQDGFDKLHEPTADPEPYYMTASDPTGELERIIFSEWQKVWKGDPSSDDAQISDRLTEDEFMAWAEQVRKAHKERTGELPRMPIAGGAGYADATETLIVDPENGKGSAYTETAPWYMAAVTVAVTDADTGSTITEANYTGYARKSVAAADMNSAASPGGSATNANAITFAACTGGSSAVIGFAKCAAATVGRLIKYGTCTTVNVSSTQQPLSFAVGAFTTSVD